MELKFFLLLVRKSSVQRFVGFVFFSFILILIILFNFISSKCGPRLSPEAAEKLKNRYVLMRNNASDYERETGKKVSIPITVR